MMTIEMGGSNDKIGHIKGEETFAIETARITLGQHKGLTDSSLFIDMTEIRTRIKTIIATGTQYEPT